MRTYKQSPLPLKPRSCSMRTQAPPTPANVRLFSQPTAIKGNRNNLDKIDLNGFMGIDPEPVERAEVVDQGLYDRLLEIEHAPYDRSKKLATKLFYSLYGKPENLADYNAMGAEPVTGKDVHGKPYSF